MSIKKLLLSALLLTTTGFAYAQEATKNYITIAPAKGGEDIALVAGSTNTDEGIVNIILENSEDWCAMQFDLILPENVIVYPGYSPDKHLTDRLNYEYEVYDEELDETYPVPVTFNLQYQQQTDKKVYRFVIYNGLNAKVEDGVNDDKTIFSIQLRALDKAKTGVFEGYIKEAHLAKSYEGDGSATVTGFKALDQTSSFKIQINAYIGAGGYGSFSWPCDVDFSAYKDVKVYTALGEADGGWLSLDELEDKLVPGGTGVFIKGTAGTTVNPTTLEEEEGLAKIQTPSIGQTSASTYTVKETDNIYALATKSKTALYPVSAGVRIPKYKAYLNSTTKNAKYISFGDTATSIEALDMAEEDGDIYTLGGQKVQNTTMKGVYIKNGKKVVVK